ncbi:uncharacterized protein LOC130052464 [Ostrea edulis]|uniref:uncharacterized protein LOC130052464 n=1 Tax=Ostrea edulis TaxID=37623 RepID=UPI0024AF2222|nr:uncharacterized protein LOC130052464 [Ostrea edulis]
MESDMIAEMVKDVNDGLVCIKAIVGDEDSTTISGLRANIDKHIGKISDANHVKKISGNSVKKEHKSLTFKVIQYLQRCFNHILAQGKGDATRIGLNLKGLAFHPFGYHSLCSSSWCRFLENPKEKYFQPLICTGLDVCSTLTFVFLIGAMRLITVRYIHLFLYANLRPYGCFCRLD